MKTNEEIRHYFDCDADMAETIMGIQQAGLDHGEAGYYPDGDFSSDADWVYGVGEKIRRAEFALDDDSGDVFDLYREAHSEGLARKDRLVVKLSDLDDYPHGDVVLAEVSGPGAHAWADSDQSIGGSSWETPSDMPDMAYAMPCNHAGLVAELRKEGYRLDLSEYSEPVALCADCDCTDPECGWRS